MAVNDVLAGIVDKMRSLPEVSSRVVTSPDTIPDRPMNPVEILEHLSDWADMLETRWSHSGISDRWARGLYWAASVPQTDYVAGL